MSAFKTEKWKKIMTQISRLKREGKLVAEKSTKIKLTTNKLLKLINNK